VTVVRDRGDARWLPSRFNFALFRLIAYLRLRTSNPESRPGIAMSIERHQSATENYLVAACVLVLWIAFTAAMLASVMPFPLACIVAFPAAALIVHLVPMCLIGLLVAPVARKITGNSALNNIAVSSAIMIVMTIAAAAVLATGTSPLRYVGTAFLFLTAINALASVVVFTMQRSIAETERRFGAMP
jgi:hypothetical protein